MGMWLIVAGKREPHAHWSVLKPLLVGGVAGCSLGMDQFERGCSAIPGNSRVAIPLPSTCHSSLLYMPSNRTSCVCMSSRSTRVCTCWKTPALLPSTRPAAWDAGARPGKQHREKATFMCITQAPGGHLHPSFPGESGDTSLSHS